MKSPYCGIDTLAAYFSVSNSTIRQWVKTDKLPEKSYIKVGNTYRFHLQAAQHALLNYDGDEGPTLAERNAIADKLIRELDVSVFGDKPAKVSEEDLTQIDEKLEEHVSGIPQIKSNPEIDESLEAILDEHDENLEGTL